MQFDEIKHRRVTIKEAKNKEDLKREINEYNRQLQVYPIMENDKIAIEKYSVTDVMYLSIYSESNKMIGIIKLKLSNDEKVGSAEISIPNPEWCRRYGTEALHQFVKRCKETSIVMLTLEEENTIVSRYKSERPNVFFAGTTQVNFIKV